MCKGLGDKPTFSKIQSRIKGPFGHPIDVIMKSLGSVYNWIVATD